MTSGTPSSRARCWCSYQALLEGPSLSRTADSPGSRGSAPSSSRAGRSGKAADTLSRAAFMKASPEGVRRLSSSTRNTPVSSRTTSKPATPIRTGG